MAPAFSERYEFVLIVPAIDDRLDLPQAQEAADISDPRLISEVVEDNPRADAYARYAILRRLEER